GRSEGPGGSGAGAVPAGGQRVSGSAEAAGAVQPIVVRAAAAADRLREYAVTYFAGVAAPVTGSESSSPLAWPSTIGRRPSHLPIARSVISSCRHCSRTGLSDDASSWFARDLPSASATSLAACARA